MSTPALTQSDFGGKFAAIQSYITPAALNLINRSESLKEAIRTYQNDNDVRKVDLDTSDKPASATYRPPVPQRKGYATFGANTLSDGVKAVQVLSHELGHYAVEGFGGAVSNARNSAYDERDFEGLEKSCNLSEGYARLASAKVAEEILSSGLTGVDAAKISRESKGSETFSFLSQ